MIEKFLTHAPESNHELNRLPKVTCKCSFVFSLWGVGGGEIKMPSFHETAPLCDGFVTKNLWAGISSRTCVLGESFTSCSKLVFVGG